MAEQTPAPTNRLPLIAAGLAVLGLAVSIYLTIVHYSSLPLICLVGTTGCEEVNRSIYSEVAGVSVALLGAGAYAALLAALWAERQAILKEPEAVLAQFGVALAGALFSLYLTYVELFVLGAVCSWCVLSALTITAIFALSVVRLRALLAAQDAPPARGKARRGKQR